MIQVGDRVAFYRGFPRVVHTSCRAIQDFVIARDLRSRGTAPATDIGIPHGVEDATVQTYAHVWQMYLQFAARKGIREIPGKHVSWDMPLLWEFMKFRAQSCKPATVISNVSALAHFGWRFQNILATSKQDGDPQMYKSIVAMRRQLKLDYRASHGNLKAAYGPDQCCPVDNKSVAMVLQALRVFSRSRFRSFSRYTRHHLFGLLMRHTHGMRFGHFPARMYSRQMFVWSAVKNAYTLVTDWHRYSGQHRYVLVFKIFPDLRPRVYELQDNGSTVFLSAAQLMQWHFADLRARDEDVVFCPDGPGIVPSRSDCQSWMRRVLLVALPLDQVAARHEISHVTSHSNRPGLAGDLLEEGMPMQAIQRICRWKSESTAVMYARRPSLSMYRTRTAVMDVTEVAPGQYMARREQQ